MADRSNQAARWLGSPMTWLAVLVAGAMGSIMTFSYIGGFLDPVGHLDGAPVGFVNADAGVTIAGAQLDAGSQLQAEVTSGTDGSIDWQVLDDRSEAERRLRNNELWGAVVVPQDFSVSLAQVGTSMGTAPPAKLAILENQGSGLFQATTFSELSDRVVATAAAQANQQLVGLLGTDATFTMQGATNLGTPVQADTRAVVELPEKSGRGLAPLYLAVMVSLTGFLAASIVSIGIDLLRGSERLEILGHTVGLRIDGTGTMWRLWLVKGLGTALGAALGGVLAIATAVSILGMDVASAGKIYALGALGAVAVGMISLVFLIVFGIAGELLGVLFTTILGVPSAFGVYPTEAMPGFFRFVGSWHPLRYLTDGIRSIAFFDASGAGLDRAVTVLAVWLAGAAVLGAAVAWLTRLSWMSLKENGPYRAISLQRRASQPG
jgi:YhgE/Pip-like protein